MSEDYYKTLIKDIIENNDKDEAIKIIANKLNEKQISNEKEMLANLDKDKEIERLKEDNEYLNKVNIKLSTEKNRLNNIIKELEEYLIEQVEKSYSNDYDNVLDKLDELKGSESNE